MYRIIYKVEGIIVGVKDSKDNKDIAEIEYDVSLDLFKRTTAVPEEDVATMYANCLSVMLKAQLLLVDDNGAVVKSCEPFWAYKQSLQYHISLFAKTKAPSLGMSLKSHIKNMFDFSDVDWGEVIIKVVVFTFVVGIGSAILLTMRSCQEDFKEKEHMAWVQSYNTYNPITLPEKVSVTETDDYMSAREDFMAQMDETYSKPRYEHSPSKVTARIDGDTLWLFANHYKDYANRRAVKDDGAMQTAFKSCQFAKVYLSTCDAGGNPVWTLYQDASIKHATAPKNNEKSNIKPRQTSGGSYTIEDAINDHVDEYLMEHGIEEADLDQ